MKQDAKNRLDKLQRQERLKNVFRTLCAIVALLVIISGFLIYRYFPGKATKVSGVVTGLHGVPVQKRGENLYLVVTLDDGKIVEVRKPNGVSYIKSARVELIKIKTSMFGNVRYDFKTYVKEILERPTSAFSPTRFTRV